VRFVFRLLACVLAGESLLRHTSTQRRLAALVSVVIGIGVLSAAFGIVRQMAQSDPAGFILPRLPLGAGYGQFINRNHFALLMEMALGLLVGLVIGATGKSESGNRFLPYLSMALLVWAALIFANSRGGIISMLGLLVCAVVTNLLIRKWRSIKRNQRSGSWVLKYGGVVVISGALTVALILLTAVGVSWVGGDPVVSRLESTSGELLEGEGHLRRKEIWEATWRLTKAYPLTGTGFGGYEAAIPQFVTGFAGHTSLRQAHNDYLEILASGGLVGAALVLWFIIAMVRKIFAQLGATNHFRYCVALGASAAIFAVGIHSVFDFGLHITVNALVFTCLVVIGTANLNSQTKGPFAPRTDLEW
jgi:O-antigen ligase